jgi:predicted porin
MNNTIKLAVASALLAAASSASAAGGIVAGDWTIDIGGNVNAYYISNNSKDSNVINGGLANTASANSNTSTSINTGLLPSWLGFTGKTRQNDLDVEFAISLQPGASTTSSLGGGGGTENRQAYISFGDKSWGTILIGKNLGEFGRDAILLDQTLLGVGSQGLVGTAGGTTTTLGRIGTGFIYADFQGQINYTTPNMNGFQAVAGIVQPIVTNNTDSGSLDATGSQKRPAFEAKGSYSFAGDVSGKVWAEVKSQKVDYTPALNYTANAFGVGANVNMAGFGLTGYYYDAKGVGTTAWLMDGVADTEGKRKSDGGYIQASYTLPGVGTKIATSWGESNLKLANGEVNADLVKKNEMFTVGAYHPLTKHLNLVAEYSQVKAKNQAGEQNKSDIVDFGAILFF